jgi:hypothetical protein|tara:strand:- start:463 stop:663 length:201 start_codon:yes stop_codon:yes gene_type:complete
VNLSKSEQEHPIWLKVESHLKDRMSLLRAKNDGPLDAVQTAHIRGQIAEVKAMLAWNIDVPMQDFE